MTKTVLHLFVALLVAATAACDRSSEQPSASDRGAVGSVPAPAPASAAPEPSYRDEDLPVPPDFEEEADQSIDDTNAADVLAEIERELDAGAPDAGADAGAGDAGIDPQARDAGKAPSPSGKAPPAPAKAGSGAKGPPPSEPY